MKRHLLALYSLIFFTSLSLIATQEDASSVGCCTPVKIVMRVFSLTFVRIVHSMRTETRLQDTLHTASSLPTLKNPSDIKLFEDTHGYAVCDIVPYRLPITLQQQYPSYQTSTLLVYSAE